VLERSAARAGSLKGERRGVLGCIPMVSLAMAQRVACRYSYVLHTASPLIVLLGVKGTNGRTKV